MRYYSSDSLFCQLTCPSGTLYQQDSSCRFRATKQLDIINTKYIKIFCIYNYIEINNINMINKLNYPIYLVSLEQDIARRALLAQRFPKYYPDFISVKAVDGRKLPAKEYYDLTITFFKKHKKLMSPAELGCSLSHIQALESFLKTDESFGLIIEDDVIGTDSDLELIQKKLSQLSEDSLLLCGGQVDLPSKKFRYGSYDKKSEIYKIATFSNLFVYGTCCYIVTKKSAQQILTYHKKGITLADKWDEFFVETATKIYYINILQHPEELGNSHIEADRLVFKNQSLLQKLFAKDGMLKAIRRLYWEAKRFSLIVTGYKKIK